MSNELLVEIKNLTKTFGDINANDHVNFTVQKNEIHALLGENGAGKSTLMNMLSGLYRPDSGSIIFEGKPCNFTSPKDSIKTGIGMIHQHFKLVDHLSAMENIILGTINSVWLNRDKEYKKIEQLMKQYDLTLNLHKIVDDMSVGEKQLLEIIKVLYRGAKLLILDEPTAVLTPQETNQLFLIMKHLVLNGCSIIFISHKLNEVMEISKRVTVLRKGKTVKTLDTDQTSPKELTHLMVGDTMHFEIDCIKAKQDEELLVVRNLTVESNEGFPLLKNVSFKLYRGEVLGLAGVSGNGQKALCEAISGLQTTKRGDIFFKKENIRTLSVKEIISRGISLSFIPEDRLGMGLVANHNIVENVLLKYYNRHPFFINRNSVITKAKQIVTDLNVQTASIYDPIKNMSGGNIQKILLGRELDTNPELLITAYAVRGLDIKTTHIIYDLLNKQKEEGVGILYVAEDLDAMMKFCDRIMVMCDGEVTGIVNPKEVSKEEIGLMMMGRRDLHVAN
ncbi:ABC transporter ATP-binding protein [Haloplasma contractile]|uniref:Methyl-galactoside transport system ATP-binding protein n=1 Tax=Haloplasma contractile SSD-17B TaxID=1033810 RepID=U2FIX2_9MOLU|nr:ABC transporter ATP-binding protein [Haloplasma contractile]ERJ11214.1 methyl-galactoside transport system ATP-binding protein [Haloplasma contractile SSD-17B]